MNGTLLIGPEHPNVTVNPNTGCWEWTGAKTKAYGFLRVDGKSWLTHRFAWTERFGPIADGLSACHRCDNPPCCNPEHLFLGTQADNVHDMMSKGRWENGKFRLTHCPQGHPYAGANLRHVSTSGRKWRRCRTCDNANRAIANGRPVECPMCSAKSTRGTVVRHLKTIHNLSPVDAVTAVTAALGETGSGQ